MIHKAQTLVFVPNTYCNLSCSYCYLGTHTNKKDDNYGNIVPQLKKIVEEFLKEGIVVESFFLHGAEVTTIPKKYLKEMFEYMKEHQNKFLTEIRTFGTSKTLIHIKTNLFNFDVLQELFDEYAVSISGSFDLPFSLHEEFRRTKSDKSTLDRIIKNIKLG